MLDVVSKLKPQNTQKDNILYLPCENVKPNPYQPRRHFDSASITELGESIKKYGVIQPISVRKIPNSFDYELVAGERRLRACIEIGMERIPAIVVKINDNDSAVIALIENLQRQDLNFLEEAEAYLHLISDHGMTQEELSAKIGKSQSAVANKLRVLKLSPTMRKLILSHNLTERHARAFLRLPDDDTRMIALKRVCDNTLTVKETERLVDTMLSSIDKEEKESKNTYVLKDVRIFLNTIKRAISVMKNSGIDAMSYQNESELYYEYVVRIPKASADTNV